MLQSFWLARACYMHGFPLALAALSPQNEGSDTPFRCSSPEGSPGFWLRAAFLVTGLANRS